METIKPTLAESKIVTYYKIQISGHMLARFFLDDQIHHLYITQGLPAGSVLFSIQKDERLSDTWNMVFIENGHLLNYNVLVQHIDLKPIVHDLDSGRWTVQEIEQLKRVIASRKDRENGEVLC